jgi:hypothetical protein
MSRIKNYKKMNIKKMIRKSIQKRGNSKRQLIENKRKILKKEKPEKL